MIYRCEHCGKFFTEDDMEEQEICLETEYGVGDLFSDRHYQTISVCPYCESENFTDMGDYEIVELLNGC